MLLSLCRWIETNGERPVFCCCFFITEGARSVCHFVDSSSWLTVICFGLFFGSSPQSRTLITTFPCLFIGSLSPSGSSIKHNTYHKPGTGHGNLRRTTTHSTTSPTCHILRTKKIVIIRKHHRNGRSNSAPRMKRTKKNKYEVSLAAKPRESRQIRSERYHQEGTRRVGSTNEK